MKRYLAILALLLLLIGTASAATYTVNFTAAAAGDARMSRSVDPLEYLSSIRAGVGTAYDSSTNPVTGVGIGSVATASKYSSAVRFGWIGSTAAIPDAATITSATFYVKGYNSTSTNGLGNLSVGLVGFWPASTSLAAADFDNFAKNGDNYLLYNDTYLRYRSGWNRDGWNAYTLNAAGLANISKTDYTPLGLMMKDDIENTTAELEYHDYANSVIKMYQSTGSSDDPYLSVTYEVPDGDSFTLTTPNGGESWARGSTHLVNWIYTGSPGANVNLTLMKAGAEAGTIVDSTPVGSGGYGNYSWNIYGTGSTGNDYTVRVKSTTSGAINDTSNANFTLTTTTVTGNRTWSGTYDFYPSNNIINVPVTNMSPHVKSDAWITNLTQLSSRWPLLYGKTGYSQPTNTETFWVVDTDTTPLTWLVSSTDTNYMHDNVAAIPIPDDLWVNYQGGDQPATLIDFNHTIAYSLSGMNDSYGYWRGSVSVWNWSTNNKRFTNSSTSSPHYNNNWNGHRYVRGNNGTVNRTETTQIWGGRSMVDLPQWAMIPQYNEVMADDVDHALYIIVPYAGNASSTLWPASNTGDNGVRTYCIPGGARVRLKSDYDISEFPPQSKAILKAAQLYGGIIGDNSQPAYGIQIYLANDTRWDTSDLNNIYNVPLSQWEVVDESGLMVSRYTMEAAGYPVASAPVANFTADQTSVVVGTTVQFTDHSTGDPVGWLYSVEPTPCCTGWMGAQNAAVNFNTPGIYNVTLTVTNDVGSSSMTRTNYITVTAGVSAPVSAFTCSPLTGYNPLSVSCGDSSTNTPTSWLWDWGDGNTSITQNPSHTYASTGLYNVNMRATNAGGSDWENKTGYVAVNSPPVPAADFYADNVNVTVGGTVQFYDYSTNTPTSWTWHIYDTDGGVTVTTQNPSHVYNTLGNYSVTLTATNYYGSDTETKTNYIHVIAGVPEPPTPTPTGTPTSTPTVTPSPGSGGSGYSPHQRPMAVSTIATIPTERYNAIMNALAFTGNMTTETPNFTALPPEIIGTYTDYMGPIALLIIFLIPFGMIWMSHGNMKLLSILGFITCLFVFWYLPANYAYAAWICMGISCVGFMWGLWKQ